MPRYHCIVAVAAFYLIHVTNVISSSQSQLPGEDCDRATYLRYNGCSRTVWEEYNRTCAEIRRRTGLKLRTIDQDLIDDVDSSLDDVNHSCYEDQILEASQAKLLLKRLRRIDRRKKRDGREQDLWRRKRAVLISATSDNRWTMPVPYQIDPHIASSPSLLQPVMAGIASWQAGTCVTFQQITPPPDGTTPNVYFYDAYSQCSSYIGRVTSVVPQPIYLGYLCYDLGTVAHEIGHALGLIHEHQRPDRNQYITVVYNDILEYDQSLFNSFDASIIQTNMLPYDYASDMHYGSQADTFNGSNTLVTLDARYQSTIGQREGLSFWDEYAINLAYCSGVCASVHLKFPCQHHGYQDPKNCSACRCPTGWGGIDCSQVAPSVGWPCGGTLTANGYLNTVESPLYNTANYYLYGQQCTWLIQASSTSSQVAIQFQGDFGIYSYTGTGSRCVDYLEIRTQVDLGLNGPRYCGTTAPSSTILSVGNQVLIIFKAIDNTSTPGDRRGFSFTYHDAGLPIMTTPIATPPTTTRTTTHTTTSARTSTSPVTTTTTKPTTPRLTPAPLAGKDVAGNAPAQPAYRPTPVLTTSTRPTPGLVKAGDVAANVEQTTVRLTPYPPFMGRRKRRQLFVSDDNSLEFAVNVEDNDIR